MAVSYKKLWHLLIDKDLKKSHLRSAAKLSSATISKLNRGDNLNTDILVRICKTLNCDISDIMEILPDEKDDEF
jgi:DNA-binding Xre family transcriptional regulator